MRIFSKNKIFILTILLVPLLYFINNTVKNEKIYFPIKEEDIEILGIKNANVNIISKFSKKYLKNRSFFNFKMKYLKKEIESIEWVKYADIRRVYPSGVRIYIEEYQPKAIWNDKGYLDSNGDIFLVNKVKKKLPKIYSENNRNHVMFDYLSLFAKYLSIYNINDSIVEIHENKIRSVKILLNSRISIELGSNNVSEKIEMFFKVYKKLKSRDLKKIRYIDMRYSNGFSIGWK